jgi:Family of unknown function (DUF6492)
MTQLAVITPTWAPDAELFEELHRSVLEYTSDDTVHHLIVPAAHKARFARYRGPRCRIWTHPELLPRRYVRLPGGIWVNPLRPWPPVRGWVMQQAAKIAATAAVDADVAMIIDSDAVLVRPASTADFTDGDALRLHRAEAAVHAGLARHVRWHHVARRLLGLPAPQGLPLPDYVTPLNFWAPAVVRAMQERITETTGRHWLDAFTAELHISEFIVYGVFVDEVHSAGHRPPPSDTAICHNFWDRSPLDLDQALAFADRLPPRALAMMISGNSRTPLEIRRAAADRVRAPRPLRTDRG